MTDFCLDPVVPYATLLANLPPGITVTEMPMRLFKEGIDHVLLRDKCGNTLWMHSATDHEIKYNVATEVGEACFVQFGLQGRIQHFGEALQNTGMLYDVITQLEWNDSYFDHCRRCSGVEPGNAAPPDQETP